MPLHDTRKELPPVNTQVIGYWKSEWNGIVQVYHDEAHLKEDGTWWESDDEWGEVKCSFPPKVWQHYASDEEVITLLKGE